MRRAVPKKWVRAEWFRVREMQAQTPDVLARVYAVVVSYNPDLPVLKRLVLSVEGQVECILLVDNGSRNVTAVAALENEVANLRLISLGENLGVAKAHNVGIVESRKAGATHVLIFDHDSKAPIDLVKALLKAEMALTRSGARVAAVGPAFHDPRTGRQYPFARINGFSLQSLYPESGSEPVEVSILISSGSLINLQTLDVVGEMREDFFIDYVDIEWCLRAGSLGYKLYGVPSVSMEHAVGDGRLKVLGREISIHSPLRRYYLARNSVLLLKLPYVPWKYKVREVFYSVSRVMAFLVFVSNRTSYLRYILKGWKDGLRGRGGRIS